MRDLIAKLLTFANDMFRVRQIFHMVHMHAESLLPKVYDALVPLTDSPSTYSSRIAFVICKYASSRDSALALAGSALPQLQEVVNAALDYLKKNATSADRHPVKMLQSSTTDKAAAGGGYLLCVLVVTIRCFCTHQLSMLCAMLEADLVSPHFVSVPAKVSCYTNS
jgi:hypothetical protein